MVSTIEEVTSSIKNAGLPLDNCNVCANQEAVNKLNFVSELPDKKYQSISQFGLNDSWQPIFIKDLESNKTLGLIGLNITMTGLNSLTKKPLDPTGSVSREWTFISESGSRQQTYIKIIDDAGSTNLSELMLTHIILIPRNNLPGAQTIGDEIHVTLTTGEKVIFDKKTKLIKSGVIEEGPIDFNPNRHQRKFAPVKYTGTGILVRIDKRGETPQLSAATATITQNNKKCSVPTTKLWKDLTFIYDDKKLVDFLNSICKEKFSIN